MEPTEIFSARARVLRDLEATRVARAEVVSMLEDAISDRSWWIQQWPAGATYVAGLIAQDVQDSLLERVGRWPLCPRCSEPHAIYIHPELGGPDPTWVCEEIGAEIAPLGELPNG